MTDIPTLADHIAARIGSALQDSDSNIYRCRVMKGFYGWFSQPTSDPERRIDPAQLDLELMGHGLSLNRFNPWIHKGTISYKIIDSWKDPLRKWQ